jgi:cyclic-di-GMP phosphodiesterase TipF (flagellum assembly factor)
VLYLLFGVTGAESSVVALAALTGLAVYNATATRVRFQSELSGQIGDLSRGTADLARQVGEQGRRLQALEKAADNSLQKAIALTQPYQNDLNDLGAMLRQLAQSVATQDTMLRELAGKAGIAAPPPEATAPVLPGAPVTVPAPADIAMPAEPKPVATEPAPTVRPQLSDTIQSGALKGLTGHAVVAAVRDAIDDNRIDVYLQPIVTLPQRKVRYYEALMRLRIDDKAIAAAEFLPWAELGGLVPGLDYLMVTRCVRVLRRLQTKTRDVGVFCNLSGITLADREAMAQIVDFAEANRALGPVLTFEIGHSVVRTAGNRENERVAAS